MQSWVKETGQRVVILSRGRDAAGKGGTIKRFMEHLNPRGTRVVALEKPNTREATQWYFQRYANHLPSAGEIVMFDRSWYNRAGVEHVMGFTAKDQYEEFMRQAPRFEGHARTRRHHGDQVLVLGLAVGAADPVHHPAHRPGAAVGSSARSTSRPSTSGTTTPRPRRRCSSTRQALFAVDRGQEQRQKRARIEAMRHVLSRLDYTGKDVDIVGQSDPAIVGPAAYVLETGERADRSFPPL